MTSLIEIKDCKNPLTTCRRQGLEPGSRFNGMDNPTGKQFLLKTPLNIVLRIPLAPTKK